MYSRGFQTSHDDVWFPRQYAKADSLLDWVLYRYNTWSGRIAIELVLPNILKANVWIWRILNTAFFLFLSAAIVLLGTNNRKPPTRTKEQLVGGSVLILLLIIKREVFEDGIFWATGSMNYLWPAASLCLTLIPFSYLFSGKDIPYGIWGLVFPFSIYAAYQEQTAPILVCYGLAALLFYRWRYHRLSTPGMIFAVISLINFCLLVFAPGNGLRMQQEIAHHYPQFTTISMSFKVLHGINYTLLNHWLYDSGKTFFVLVCLTFYLAKTRAKSKVLDYSLYLALVYVLLSLVLELGPGGDWAHFFNYDIYDYAAKKSGEISFGINPIPFVTGLLILFLLPVAWYGSLGFSALFVRITLFYIAGLLSSLVIGISPTIFASSYRIFFIPDIMLVIVTTMLFAEALQHLDIRKKSFVFGYGVLTATGLSAFIHLL